MPDYSTFTVEDFIADPAFQNWVRNPTAADEAFWQEWLRQHPERTDEVRLARQFVVGLQIEQPTVSPEQIRQDVQHMLQKIRAQHAPVVSRTKTRPLWTWAAVAAAVGVLVSIWWFTAPVNSSLTRSSATAVRQADGTQLQRNDTPKPLQFTLPDGSQVTLSPRSSLTYPAVFGDSTREVTLTGEAFFQIVRNPAHPFLVYADQIVTRVLGTSFRVRAYPQDPHLTVAVRTGKVAVYARSDYSDPDQKQVDRRVIALTPNQQVDFSKEQAEFRKTLVANPVLIDQRIKLNRFDFDETPVREVFQRFEQAYGVSIIYDSDLLRDCALTASLTEETLPEKLAIVCKGISATYEIIDGQIVIHSKGCQ